MVRLVWPEPSAFITYISQLPSRSEWNAILLMGVGVAVAVGSDVGVGIGVDVGVAEPVRFRFPPELFQPVTVDPIANSTVLAP